MKVSLVFACVLLALALVMTAAMGVSSEWGAQNISILSSLAIVSGLGFGFWGVQKLQKDLLSLHQELRDRKLEAQTLAEKIKEQPKPISPQVAESSQDALALLTLLQERGRLVDFLMEDITSFPDAQVAAAARVVHQGSRKVLQECFAPSPLTPREEGIKVSISEIRSDFSTTGLSELEEEKGAPSASLFRLIGKVPDDIPSGLQGTLVHRGWVSGRLNVPTRVTLSSPTGKNIITPVEIEI